MKHRVAFFLNLPWTLFGFYQALLCGISKFRYDNNAFIFVVERFKSLTPIINMIFAAIAFLNAGDNVLINLISGFAFIASFDLLFLTMGGAAGLTRGHTILIKKENSADKTLLRHENIHVEQADRYFGLLPILYILEFCKEGFKILWQGIKLFPKAGYWHNKYEKEAYERAAKETVEEK